MFSKKFPRFSSLPIVLICLLESGPLWAGLVINELLPDPSGTDSGKEFVELMNTGPGVFHLDEVELQFGNGATGPPWLTRWRGHAGIVLQQGQRFLLVDRNWQGAEVYQVEVWLGLQNGPDAIRLVKHGTILDLVGYGPLTDGEMIEEVAADHTSGLSLARKPDGRDTDNNLLDFHATDPTPGLPNFLANDLRVESLTMEPPSSPVAGQCIQVGAVLRNGGLEDFPVCEARVLLQTSAGEVTTVLETLFAGCPMEATCQIHLLVTPVTSGRFMVILDLDHPADAGGVQLTLGELQVGLGAVYLSEVMGAPDRHQGEWVEITGGNSSVNLEIFSIRDEEGSWRQLPDVVLDPGDIVVVAQDSSSLIQWHEANLAQRVPLNCPDDQLQNCLRQLNGTWPTLNNSPPEGRPHADRVYLADEFGVVIDHVTIPDFGTFPDSDGASWERVSAPSPTTVVDSWRPSVGAPGSTPGCSSSFGNGGSSNGFLTMVPRVFDPERGLRASHIRFEMQDGEPGWHLEIYDLWGRLIRDFGGAETGPGAVDVIWDGRDDQGQTVEAGGYVVLLCKSGRMGSYRPVGKILVVVR